MFRFSADFCPELADPIGGTQLCKDWGSGGQFKVCEISCNTGLRFSQEVPKFYTCGAEGFWRPTNDPSLPLIYPACTSKFSSFYSIRSVNKVIILLFLFVVRCHARTTCIQNQDELPDIGSLQRSRSRSAQEESSRCCELSEQRLEFLLVFLRR